jgi:hypothetical protein
MTLMVASVPELHMRMSSIDGTIPMILRATTVSSSVGAPKESPLTAASCTARTTSGCAWPRIIGPHEPT